MPIIIATISILILTGVVWLINKIFSTKVCHICAGVFLTWFWMIIGIFTDQLPIADYQLPVAILIGGSVVGFAYWIEKHKTLRYLSVTWKILFIPIGFIAAYSLISTYANLPAQAGAIADKSIWWIVFFVAVVLLVLLTALFLRPRAGVKNKKDEITLALGALSSKARKADLEKSKAQKLDIEKEMKDCC